MRIALVDEPPFIARLDEVRGQLQPIKGEIAGLAEKVASLTELDTAGKPVGVRHLPWPPDGEVRVLRTP